MYYSETNEKAAELFRLVLAQMAQFKVAPTPINYTLWYEYVSGTNEPLKRQMDQLLNDGTPLTPEILEALYRQHIFDGERLASKKIFQEVQTVIEEVATYVKEAGGDVAQQGGKLKALAGRLEVENDLAVVRKLVDFLVSATREVLGTSSSLETKLSETTREVNTLREKMAHLKTQALTDALTGLVNRWGLEKLLRREMQRAKADQKDLCLVMADIDHFKMINDTYGHLVGDNVIKMLAATLIDFFKNRQMVIRYGGEEFLVVLPDCALDTAVSLSEKLKGFLETMKWKRKGTGNTMGKITLSFGVARYRYDESMEDFIQRVDEALYRSKKNGRNRVTSEALPAPLNASPNRSTSSPLASSNRPRLS
jgi:diguanylate cyclase